jgi:hypothetical protein
MAAKIRSLSTFATRSTGTDSDAAIDRTG